MTHFTKSHIYWSPLNLVGGEALEVFIDSSHFSCVWNSEDLHPYIQPSPGLSWLTSMFSQSVSCDLEGKLLFLFAEWQELSASGSMGCRRSPVIVVMLALSPQGTLEESVWMHVS